MDETSGSVPTSKVWAIVGYLFPVLFFVPLITEAKGSSFARYHANQQLLLLIWYIIANVIALIPLLGWIASPIMMVIGIVLAIMGVINAAQGRTKPLPIIGAYTLLK